MWFRIARRHRKVIFFLAFFITSSLQLFNLWLYRHEYPGLRVSTTTAALATKRDLQIINRRVANDSGITNSNSEEGSPGVSYASPNVTIGREFETTIAYTDNATYLVDNEDEADSDFGHVRNENDTDTAKRGLQDFHRYLIKREFVKSENGKVFIFGAVVRNSSDTSAWDVCNIYGEWLESSLDKEDEDKVMCCLKYNSSAVLATSVNYFGKTWHNNKLSVKLQPWYVTCSLPITNLTLKWISVVRASHKCGDTSTRYIEPLYAVKQEQGHLVISTKTAHEKLDPNLIISQFETLRYLGVDKVITYVENTLWDKAKQVLGYYASVGFLEIYSYELADTKDHPRKIAQQDNQIFADQTTVMRDAVERSSGSTYFGILDNDEFPIPSGNRTLKETLNSLGRKYPKASSFVFKNQHFFTDVQNSSWQDHRMFFSRYLYTLPSLNMIHRKAISYPSRIWTGTLYSHKAKPLRGFREEIVDEGEVYIRHYGFCERKFNPRICSNRDNWVYNSSLVDWAKGTVSGRIDATLNLFL